MTVFISMLRGINVSGQKKIKMDELRKLYESLGFENVQSYIQSGNVIFKSALADTKKIVETIEVGIKQEFGYDVIVILRTREELQKIVSNNPFLDKELSKVHVVYLSKLSGEYSEEELSKPKDPSEEFQIKEKEIYLYLPKGSGRTKLTNNFFEKKLGVKATTRNWNSTTKILNLSKTD